LSKKNRLFLDTKTLETEPASETWHFSVYKIYKRWTRSKKRRLHQYVVLRSQSLRVLN